MSASLSDWDPIMLDTYLSDLEQAELSEQVLLDARRSVMGKEIVSVDLSKRLAMYDR